MKTGLDKKTFLVLAIGLSLLWLCGTKLKANESNALLAGYILFSLNFMFLTKIYAGLVHVTRTGQASARLKTFLLIGSAIKFLGLIAGMYALIILWELPGLFIAVGSLVSLFLLTTLLVLSYLKTFGPSSPS